MAAPPFVLNLSLRGPEAGVKNVSEIMLVNIAGN